MSASMYNPSLFAITTDVTTIGMTTIDATNIGGTTTGTITMTEFSVMLHRLYGMNIVGIDRTAMLSG
jgi:hypothetical protein